ncbi:MAG TPA: DUF3667 domain-containing protein [Opitutaceae bacterium]|jgi:hypothetical protein|nr:DUF3667 domain-containing protein [Opitutaceae bacterium]
MSHAAGHSACQNCGAALQGPYCSQCGQHDVDYHRSIKFLLEDALEGFLHFDGKFLATVRYLLTRPGFLTTEFLAGRRARYAPPLRFYLFASFLAFLAMSLAPAQLTWKRAPSPASPHVLTGWQAIFRPEVMHSEEFATRLHHYLPGALFLCVPVLALFLKLAYGRSRQFYAAHLIFALHLQSFIMLTMLADEVGQWAFGHLSAGAAAFFHQLLSLYIVYIFYRALRVVYRQGRVLTAAKLAVIGFLHAVVVALATAGAVVLSAKLAA